MSEIATEKLKDFFAQFPEQKFAKRDVIISDHERVKFLYFLKNGLVRQYATTHSGNELMLHIYRPHSLFPLALVLSQTPNRFAFQALTSVTVHRATPTQVIDWLKTEPEVLFALMQNFASGLMGLATRLEHTLFEDAPTKVASFLFYLATTFGHQVRAKTTIVIPVSHQNLADWLGLARETVSRQMEKLKHKKLIAYSRTAITIKNLSGLEKIVP